MRVKDFIKQLQSKYDLEDEFISLLVFIIVKWHLIL